MQPHPCQCPSGPPAIFIRSNGLATCAQPTLFRRKTTKKNFLISCKPGASFCESLLVNLDPKKQLRAEMQRDSSSHLHRVSSHHLAKLNHAVSLTMNHGTSQPVPSAIDFPPLCRPPSVGDFPPLGPERSPSTSSSTASR